MKNILTVIIGLAMSANVLGATSSQEVSYSVADDGVAACTSLTTTGGTTTAGASETLGCTTSSVSNSGLGEALSWDNQEGAHGTNNLFTSAEGTQTGGAAASAPSTSSTSSSLNNVVTIDKTASVAGTYAATYTCTCE